MTDYVGNGRGPVSLDVLGLRPQHDVYWNVIVPELYEHVARRREGLVACAGPRRPTR